jgi:hypothetical protein
MAQARRLLLESDLTGLSEGHEATNAGPNWFVCQPRPSLQRTIKISASMVATPVVNRRERRWMAS